MGLSDVLKTIFQGARNVEIADRRPAPGDRVVVAPPTPQPVSDHPTGVNVHGKPCRLHFCYPPNATGSWLGGCPNMPDDLDWPVSNGVPMVFYAQIDLTQVPRATWGGLHPETGWLALFIGAHGTGEACALYIPELGQPRQRPFVRIGTDGGYYLGFSLKDIAETLYPDQSTCHGAQMWDLPSWPLVILPCADGETPRMGPILSNEIPRADLSDPAWHPFDRLSQLVFLRACEVVIDQEIRRIRRAPRPQDPQAAAGFDEVLSSLQELSAGMRRALIAESSDMTGPLSSKLAALITRIMDGLSYRRPVPGGTIETRRMVDSLSENRAFIAGHEYAARRALLEQPDALPEAVRDLFEPYWREATETEIMTLGGRPTDYMEAHGLNGAKLLELPCSPLMGWMFGDMSNAALAIDADALADGKWHATRYCDDHGM